MKKNISVLIIAILLIIFNSCTPITEQSGKSGLIIGTIIDLGNQKYGIDGIARPVGKLFYSLKNVKYTIHEGCVEPLFELYKVGDQINYHFTYSSIVAEGDWNTVISIHN